MQREYYEGLSDDELIALSRDKDDRATETLMSRYKGLVRSRARSMFILGGDSEDLIQEGMLGLFKALQEREDLKYVTDVMPDNYDRLTKNFGLSNGIGVAAGAQFRMNTKSGDTFFGFGTGKSTQALIDVPILLNYGIGINRDLTITPFVGPMLSLALVGNTKTSIGNSTTTSNWYGDNSRLNRFNLYAVFGADVKFSQFNLFGGYRLGLLDLNSSDNITLKANGLFIGLGYSL